MDQVIAILQARMHSERLPGKILADLAGKPLISHVIERLQATRGIDRVVLAVPEVEAAYLAEVIDDSGIELVTGGVKDVLGRFYKAAKRFQAPFYVRATGDNPLIDPGMLARCITECKTGFWDMVGAHGMPLGTSAEVFPAGLLDYLNIFGRLPHHREHVTTCLYEQEEDFRVKRLTPPRRLQAPEYRLTVDTREDLGLMNVIYDNLYEPGRIVDLEEAIKFLREYPDFAEINSHVRQRNWREESRRYSSAVA